MIVSEAAAASDRAWFSERPNRRFRVRPGDGAWWLVRCRPRSGEPNVFLRVASLSTRPLPPDSDKAIAPLWYSACFPDWPADEIQKAALRALRKSAR
jgi:hypothetical protein